MRVIASGSSWSGDGGTVRTGHDACARQWRTTGERHGPRPRLRPAPTTSRSPSRCAILTRVSPALRPTPPGAAAAPGCGGGPSAPPTEAGEALLPGLIALFTALAAASPPGTVPLTPPAEPWQLRYEGRFRRHGRPAAGVWTAETVGCPACGGQAGPWTVTCDWRRLSLGCPCGVVTDGHGLAFSEVWLLLPDL